MFFCAHKRLSNSTVVRLESKSCRRQWLRASIRVAKLALVTIMFFVGQARLTTAAELWTYQGKITPDNSDDEGVRKEFRLHVLWQEGQPPGVWWVLEDEDPRAVAWSQRFGYSALVPPPSAGSSGPRLNLPWQGAAYTLPVLVAGPTPGERWKTGLRWESDGLGHEVVEEVRVGEQPAFIVQVRSPIGWKRQVVQAGTAQRILELSERFFIGQGSRHLLTVRLLERRAIDPAMGERWQMAWREFDGLRQAIEENPNASNGERTSWRARLVQLHETAPEPWQRLAHSALQQIDQQQTRQAGLEHVRRQALTKSLPQLQAEAVTGTVPSQEQLARRVVVLHFWDYRDQPLHEPYGQVGYLDFLYRKYSDQGLVILGVVTNQQSESPTGKRTAALGARKFAQFMNLAYPVVQDGGALLRHVGDPRLHDGELPLFVVADRSGRIIHYRVGFYPADTQRGLVELENVIRQALQSAP